MSQDIPEYQTTYLHEIIIQTRVTQSSKRINWNERSSVLRSALLKMTAVFEVMLDGFETSRW